MLTRNGSCVMATVKSSAGSSGSRRRQADEKGSPTFPFSVASAAIVIAWLLDRLRCDVLALAQRVGVLHRAGDHGREELRTAVADVLELRDADVLHAGQARALGGTGVRDRSSLHRGERLGGEGGCSLLVLRERIGGESGARRDRRPAALRVRAGGLDVLSARRPGDVLPGVGRIG